MGAEETHRCTLRQFSCVFYGRQLTHERNFLKAGGRKLTKPENPEYKCFFIVKEQDNEESVGYS
jgi:hypothetical protein